jgi:hypothetical protein
MKKELNAIEIYELVMKFIKETNDITTLKMMLKDIVNNTKEVAAIEELYFFYLEDKI